MSQELESITAGLSKAIAFAKGDGTGSRVHCIDVPSDRLALSQVSEKIENKQILNQ